MLTRTFNVSHKKLSIAFRNLKRSGIWCWLWGARLTTHTPWYTPQQHIPTSSQAALDLCFPKRWAFSFHLQALSTVNAYVCAETVLEAASPYLRGPMGCVGSCVGDHSGSDRVRRFCLQLLPTLGDGLRKWDKKFRLVWWSQSKLAHVKVVESIEEHVLFTV